jgi:hypothetical protein
MPPKKTLPPSASQGASGDRQISVGGDIVDSVVIAGDGNKVNIIQKFFNIFKSDAETVDQRNRRIMLGHVENFWIKGILEKSLHGAALLDLGIKEDPDALNYPWAIKREANKETLPPNTSMLEIFQEIGMGRSLLILGAPGSGKTTMLLELTRQLIERAREDVTEPIPVVFNLSSWTEKLTLADWLARELNVIYTIPKKIAPTWVKENKMLLLLDGLDEVRQESRDKCVDAINQFRKENGLTSMVVCSRIQDYAELKTKLSFDGAIEIQPLTSNQVDAYFKHFGKRLAGVRQVLKKDIVLREMAETPLFLSIMTLAYRDRQGKDILVSESFDMQRKHLFDTYIERMFERPERSKNEIFKKYDVVHWLSWLAQKMAAHNQAPYLLENMQAEWLSLIHKYSYRSLIGLIGGIIFLSISVQVFGFDNVVVSIFGPINPLGIVLFSGLLTSMLLGFMEIEMADILTWKWKFGFIGLIGGLILGLIEWLIIGPIVGRIVGLGSGILFGVFFGLRVKPISQATYPGQKIFLSIKNFFFLVILFFGLFVGIIIVVRVGLSDYLVDILAIGLMTGLIIAGRPVIQHYILRLIMSINNNIPWKMIPFLNHCVDLIFLRRVGGGYIFVHRLLMEHFAAMYVEEEK